MPVMDIEFCIPAVGYFCSCLGLSIYFARSSSHSSSVQYGHLFIVTREGGILEKTEVNKIIKTLKMDLK